MPRIGNKNAMRHGHTSVGNVLKRTLTYNSWRCMKERCYYEKHKWFDAYGGRGITVCDRWLGKDGFKNFLADMGERPCKEMTMDRKEVNGNYCKDNCCWGTKSDQRINIRNAASMAEAA